MKCRKNDCFSCKFPDCINDYVAPIRAKTAVQKAANAKQYRDRYYAARAAGLCVQCRARSARPGHVLCAECNNRKNRLVRERMHDAGRPSRSEMDGVVLCTQCGKRHPVEGHKLCGICYDKALVSLGYANARRKAKRERGESFGP